MTQSNILLPPPSSTIRDLGDAISPTYLNGPVFKAYRYSMAVMLDGLIDGATFAVRARYPLIAPSDALQWLGQDRQIFQGPSESGASYTNRLVQWLDLWRHAGTSTGVMLAYLAWLTPLTPAVLTVQATSATVSTWDSYPAGSVPLPPGQANPQPPVHTVVNDSPNNWQWDSASQPYYSPWMWWRQWIIVSSFSGSPWPAPTKTWGTGGTLSVSVVSDATYGTKYVNAGTPASPSATSFVWGDGTCWGWAGTAAQAESLTGLAVAWKSAGVWVPWVIVNYDATMFDHTQAFGSAKLPDGHWGYAGKVVSDATFGTKYVRARPAASTCTLITGSNDGGGVLGLG